MKSFKIKAKIYLSSKLSLVILVGLLACMLVQFSQIFYKHYETEQEMVNSQKEIERLQGQQTKLKDLLVYLNSDFFAEREARIKLGMQKPGEEAVVLPHEPKKTDLASGDGSEQQVNSAQTNVETSDVVKQTTETKLEEQRAKKENNPARWEDYFLSDHE